MAIFEDDFLNLMGGDNNSVAPVVEEKKSVKEDDLTFPSALKEMVQASNIQKTLDVEKENRIQEKENTQKEVAEERNLIKERINSNKKTTTTGTKGYTPKTQEEKDLVGYNQVCYAIYDNTYVEENALKGLESARAKHGIRNDLGEFVPSEVLDLEKNIVNAKINEKSVATSSKISSNLKKIDLNEKAYLIKLYPEVEKLLNENLMVKDEKDNVIEEGDKASLIQMLLVYALDKLKEDKKQLVVLYNNTKTKNNTLSEDLEIDVENMKVVGQRYKK